MYYVLLPHSFYVVKPAMFRWLRPIYHRACPNRFKLSHRLSCERQQQQQSWLTRRMKRGRGRPADTEYWKWLTKLLLLLQCIYLLINFVITKNDRNWGHNKKWAVKIIIRQTHWCQTNYEHHIVNSYENNLLIILLIEQKIMILSTEVGNSLYLFYYDIFLQSFSAIVNV